MISFLTFSIDGAGSHLIQKWIVQGITTMDVQAFNQ